jgi:hypothetical protein
MSRAPHISVPRENRKHRYRVCLPGNASNERFEPISTFYLQHSRSAIFVDEAFIAHPHPDNVGVPSWMPDVLQFPTNRGFRSFLQRGGKDGERSLVRHASSVKESRNRK